MFPQKRNPEHPGCIFLHLRLSQALDITDFSIAVVLSGTSCLIKISHPVTGASELGLVKMLQNDTGVQFMLLKREFVRNSWNLRRHS